MSPRQDPNITVEQSTQPALRTSALLGVLHRTELSPADKVDLAAAALGRRDEFGAKTALAQQFEVSRPTVYSAKSIAAAVLGEHFEKSTSNKHRVIVDDTQVRRAIVGLRIVAPNSLRSIEALLPLLYPGVTRSYGFIQQVVVEAEGRARNWNLQAELSGISAVALDEMFSQGNPVLAGVDLDSGHLFALEKRDGRSGDDWAQVLEVAKTLGMDLKVVVKDAALGIEYGVRKVFPDAEQRDDCFHAHYEMGKARRILEQRAYAAIAAEEAAQFKQQRLYRTGRGVSRRKLAGRLAWAKRNCVQKLELHDKFETAMHTAQEAMELVDLEGGRLRGAGECQTSIESAAQMMQQLDDDRCKKVGKYIENRAPGLVLYITALHQELSTLADHYSQDLVALACMTWRLSSDLQSNRRRGQRTRAGDIKHLMGALALLRARVGDQGDALMGEVERIFERRHRASSAIEGFNAALRPYLYVHKRVSQGFLELFRAHYNLRLRRWGRHKGTSAHECLTGDHVDDWLDVLGYPTSLSAH